MGGRAARRAQDVAVPASRRGCRRELQGERGVRGREARPAARGAEGERPAQGRAARGRAAGRGHTVGADRARGPRRDGPCCSPSRSRCCSRRCRCRSLSHRRSPRGDGSATADAGASGLPTPRRRRRPRRRRGAHHAAAGGQRTSPGVHRGDTRRRAGPHRHGCRARTAAAGSGAPDAEGSACVGACAAHDATARRTRGPRVGARHRHAPAGGAAGGGSAPQPCAGRRDRRAARWRSARRSARRAGAPPTSPRPARRPPPRRRPSISRHLRRSR